MNFNVSQKLGINNITIVLSVICSALYTIYILNFSENISNKIVSKMQPSVNMIDEFHRLTTKSIDYTKDWIYEPSNKGSKNELIRYNKEYAVKREELYAKVDEWASDEQKLELANVFLKCDSVVILQNKIMDTLGDLNSYLNNTEAAEKMFLLFNEEALSVLNDFSIIHTQWINEINSNQNEMLNSFSFLQKVFYFIIILVIGIGVGIYIITYQSIVKPIEYLKNVIVELSLGKQPSIKIKENKDEIGEMITSIKNLISGLKQTSSFARSIGETKLDEKFEALSEEDVLGNSLLLMRDNLKNVAQQEFERNWNVEGVAKFGVLLRENMHNLESLGKEIITHLVKHLNANQGGIFIIKEDEKNNEYLDLIAFYAFDRLKFPDKKVMLGEGLLGQCWQEKESIYLTDIPDTFMEIKSGLGGAKPKSVLIVPLIVNEQIFGVIELSSFQNLDKYKIDFVEKLGESIASTVSNVLINIKTQKLLDESKAMTEQLQSQEEEIRQNTEEMLATQEELQRKIEQLESKLKLKQ